MARQPAKVPGAKVEDHTATDLKSQLAAGGTGEQDIPASNLKPSNPNADVEALRKENADIRALLEQVLANQRPQEGSVKVELPKLTEKLIAEAKENGDPVLSQEGWFVPKTAFAAPKDTN